MKNPPPRAVAWMAVLAVLLSALSLAASCPAFTAPAEEAQR